MLHDGSLMLKSYILGTIARPLFASAAGALGREVLKRIAKKYLGAKNVVEKEGQKGIDMPTNNILVWRLPNLRHVQLPNGCVFLAKYERLNIHAVAPTEVRIVRRYVLKIGLRQQKIRRIGPRNRQRRRQQADTSHNIATATDLGKRSVGSKLGKMMINDAIDFVPTTYKKIKNKITNEKVMNMGVDDYLVNRGVELIG